MSGNTTLVTGATGNLGSAVVQQLAGRGLPIRAAGTDTARVELQLPSVDGVHLDLTDPTTFGPALQGVQRLFLVRPPAIARVKPTINRFLDVAADTGVEHVVFASVLGAESNRIVPHHRIEAHLRTLELSWTVLRPGFFAQNLATAYARDIALNDRILLPAGDGRVAFIDTRDIGAIAADILADPARHEGRAYPLTGPAAWSFPQVAALLTTELGREISYEPTSVIGYLRHLARQGLPLPQRLVQTVLHTGLRRGDAEVVDPTAAQLLGRPATSLATYIHEHREVWAEPT